ncbi:MAG: hypothetical protein LBU58_01235 [Clostridiales bacterium]|jgi:hypothetical protein|nr:hypothetical protein [Clostridiales bacterium]
MVLSGKIVKGHKTLYDKNMPDACGEAGAAFRDRLEDCLIRLCKDADIPVPMWLAKNSTELARFGRTNFYAEQFAEKVVFDRFEIRIAER